MGIITMHLVCFSKIYRSKEDDFLKLNTLLSYDHVTVYSPTLGPEPRVMHFTIFLDGFMDIITMLLVFSPHVVKVDKKIF